MTPRQQLQMSFWQIAEPTTVQLSNDIVRDMIMGKKTFTRCQLSLLNNLWFYLDILQQQREIDYTNGVFTQDYATLYCIKSIKKALECSGLSSSLISDLIATYLNDVSTNLGIGGMVIQGAVNPFHVRGDSGQTGGYVSTTVPTNVIQSYITYIINQNVNQCCSVKPIRVNISADTIFVSLLPGNYLFNSVVFTNLTNNWAQLSMGITSGGVECFGSVGLDPTSSPTQGRTTIFVNKTFSITVPTTLYLHHASGGDAWNSAIFDIEFIFDRL